VVIGGSLRLGRSCRCEKFLQIELGFGAGRGNHRRVYVLVGRLGASNSFTSTPRLCLLSSQTGFWCGLRGVIGGSLRPGRSCRCEEFLHLDPSVAFFFINWFWCGPPGGRCDQGLHVDLSVALSFFTSFGAGRRGSSEVVYVPVGRVAMSNSFTSAPRLCLVWVRTAKASEVIYVPVGLVRLRKSFTSIFGLYAILLPPSPSGRAGAPWLPLLTDGLEKQPLARQRAGKNTRSAERVFFGRGAKVCCSTITKKTNHAAPGWRRQPLTRNSVEFPTGHVECSALGFSSGRAGAAGFVFPNHRFGAPTRADRDDSP